MESLAAIQAALADEDRTVDAFVPAFWVAKFPNNHRHEKGITVTVFGVRPEPRNDTGYEIQIGYKPDEIWVEPIEVRVGWSLCDGCKAPISQCCCDEIAADRAEEFGPWCDTCGCDGETDYMNCIYGGLYTGGKCPMLTGTF